LCANKCDLIEERKIPKSKGEKLASDWGSPFF